ncbi:RmlC-like cupin domain-containing protein [Rhodocollybia butyracea]|uniref:RmlC-like cupin domain-containing protein n=1 Tax=Rhodocollybia butyracea TaxID=206335 RepID=A0A9P5Q7H8_9AGAR|nr:RmlC-like cupin domain-containing protein [Rhodocollybia butyracea]
MLNIRYLIVPLTISLVYGAVLGPRDSPFISLDAAQPISTIAFASTASNDVLWGSDSPPSVPKPFRGTTGASVQGPDNVPLDLQNPDLLAPRVRIMATCTPNSKWPFSMSHMRLQTGGWARQANIAMFPIATSMAGVNMRLEAGAIRELHWHSTAEWAYVIKGTTQITSVDQDGRSFIATVFPDGAFTDDGTFLLTDWLAHVPAEVIRKNFGITNPDAFSSIPSKQLYIFPGRCFNPQGSVPQPFFFPFSQMNATQLEGGTVKIADSTTFTIAKEIAVVEVSNHSRGYEWHNTEDEWTFILEGEARITVFAANSNSRTFNYQVTAFVPASYGHYVENTGNSTLKYLELFNTDRFQDVSLNQWLALTPPALVKAHLGLDDETIALLKKVKPGIVGPTSPQ